MSHTMRVQRLANVRSGPRRERIDAVSKEGAPAARRAGNGGKGRISASAEHLGHDARADGPAAFTQSVAPKKNCGW